MRSWKKSFAALWTAEFLAILGFSTSNPIIPLFLTELGVTDPARLNWWNGAINAVPAIVLAVFAPIWGSLADSYGRKLMLLRAMIGGSILMGLLALADSPWQVLVLKTLQGLVTGTVAAATVLTASIVPAEEAGYRLGLLQMAVFLGSSVGPLFGGVVTDLFGSRVNFLATAALLAAASIMVARLVGENFAPRPRSVSVLRSALPDLGILAASPVLLPLFVVTFAVQLANATAGPILPLVVLDMARGQPGIGSISGLVIGGGSVTAAIGAVAIGRISAKIGYGRALVICVAGACLFSLPQGLATTPYELLALRLGSGAFLGGTMPAVNALITLRCDRSRQGSAFGLSSSVSGAGAALGPALGALVATELGYPAVFYATGLALALTCVLVAPTILRRSESAKGAAPLGIFPGGGDE